MTRLLLLSAFAAALAACSEEPATPGAIEDSNLASPGATPDPAPPPGAAASATVGGDGSELALTGLQESDIDDRLRGELRCAFTDADGALLLMAAANAGGQEPIFALVKNGGYVEILTGRTGGGYDRMVDGTGYGGRGLTVEIARLSAQSLNAGREGLAYPATLRADRADGARRTWDGVWSCGP